MKKISGQKVVSVGTHIEIELIHSEGSDPLAFDIVPDEQADFSRGYLGVGTPLAKAILGHPAGTTVPYLVGDATEVRIKSVTVSSSVPTEDVQKRRQEVIRKAIDYSDRTNAMIFASSFSGKWGDYDPTGFVDEEQENQSTINKDEPEEKSNDR